MSIHTASLATLEKPIVGRRPKKTPAIGVDLVLNWADQHRRWILLALIVIYLTGFTGQWQPESDSALYLSLGRSLALGHGFSVLGQPNHLAYAGLPWLIAATFKIFGVDQLFPIHLIILLLAWGALAMLYALLSLRSGRPTAVVVTTIVALSDTFFRYSMKVLTDMPFMAGVMAVFLGCELIGWAAGKESENRRIGESEEFSSFRRFSLSPIRPLSGWLLLIIGLAIATTMRPVIWALLFTLLVATIISPAGKKGKWKYLLIAGLAVATVIGFFFLDPRREGSAATLGIYEQSALSALRDGQMFHRMLHGNLSMMLGWVTAEALLGMRVGPVLNQIVAITAIVLGIGLWRKHPLWGLWVAITLFMMLAMLPVRRYYLPIMPFLILGVWQGICWLNRAIPNRGIANILCASLLIVLAGSNVARCINVSLQQHGIFVWAKNDRGSEDVFVRQFAAEIKAKLPTNAVVLAPRRFSRVLGYLSNRRTIPSGSHVQMSALHSPTFVILPIGRTDGLLTADLQRLGLKPGRQVTSYQTSAEFQFAVYELPLPPGK